MAFDRPTLSELQELIAQDIAASLPGSDARLRYSNLAIMGAAVAGMAHLHYGHLDWISRQAVPVTAEGVYLEMWAGLKGVVREGPASASGRVSFPGTNGTLLPSGTPLSRADGKTFVTTADGTVAGGTVTVPATAVPDPDGLTGAWGDMSVGTAISLGQSVSGVSSSGNVSVAFTGGADLDDDDALLDKTLHAYQNPVRGGSAVDFVTWALSCPGVTRAWCPPSVMGPGTVQVYFMLDEVQAAHAGFPQGTNGVATAETRDTPAAGDQLAVANTIYPLRPVTALVYACAPAAFACNFTISGLASAPSTVRAAVQAAVVGALLDKGDLAGTVNLSDIEAAVAAVSGSAGFVIQSPTANLVAGTGQLHTLGTITWV